jgi:release factor glutamine methyltransferase
MQWLLRQFATRLVRPFVSLYLKGDRYYDDKKRGLKIFVPRGVFHPGMFYSSNFMADFLEKQQLAGKTFLEIGSGSGFLSLVAAKRGALVTAVDINPDAVEATKKNAADNGFPNIVVLQSDIFSAIPDKSFDVIIVNPPYFPKDPVTADQYAWYCGENFDFFGNLFKSLSSHPELLPKGLLPSCFMVLSSQCNLEFIKGLALKHGLELKLVDMRGFATEDNYIFSVVSS